MVTKIVPFRVVFATSEDDDEHEANELLAPGPDTRGWASDAYCIYPQVIFCVLLKVEVSAANRDLSYAEIMGTYTLILESKRQNL